MSNVTVDVMGRIPMSPSLAATLGRANHIAEAGTSPEITLEHLLLALAEDPDACSVMAMSGVELDALRSDVSAHLARSHDRQGPGGTDGVLLSEDVKRILEAAAAAAMGRRREIDGAIVVAAIVGDGNSTAAHLLRARGMTFEEAIKALQQYAVRHSEPKPAPTKPTPHGLPTSAGPHSPPSLDAEGILASARQRVATRTGASPAEPFAKPEPTAQHDEPAESLSTEPAAATAPTEDAVAPRAEGAAAPSFEPDWSPAVVPAPPLPEKVVVPGSVPRPAARKREPPRPPPPPPMPPPSHARPEPMPASGRRPDPMRAPMDEPPQRDGWAPTPVPDRGSEPSPPRPARPPLPQHPDVAGRPPTPPRMPPPPFSPQPMPRPPAPGAGPPPGAAGMPQSPSQLRPPPPAGAPPPRQADGARAARGRPAAGDRSRTTGGLEPGQMVENIPRTMQVAVPKTVEVRIAKADAKALAEGLQGGGVVWQHDVMVSKAMSVRLRAPEGGFYIETASPETQWIESQLGGPFADDFASWRWTVTPKARGTRRLLLVVSIRTVGADGLAAETALPDQIFEIKVRTNYGLATRRWVGWVVAAVAGGLLARFGDGLFETVVQAVKVLVK